MKELLAIIRRFTKLAQIDRGPDGEFGYHVTYYKNLPGISSSGLQAQGGGSALGVGGYAGHSGGSSFITEEGGIPFWFQRMEEMAEASSDDVLADGLIPIALRFYWPKELEWDEAGSTDARHDAFMTSNSIPPDNIQLYNGSAWIPIQSWNSINPEDAIEKDEDEDRETGEIIELNYLSPSSPFQP